MFAVLLPQAITIYSPWWPLQWPLKEFTAVAEPMSHMAPYYIIRTSYVPNIDNKKGYSDIFWSNQFVLKSHHRMCGGLASSQSFSQKLWPAVFVPVMRLVGKVFILPPCRCWNYGEL